MRFLVGYIPICVRPFGQSVGSQTNRDVQYIASLVMFNQRAERSHTTQHQMNGQWDLQGGRKPLTWAPPFVSPFSLFRYVSLRIVSCDIDNLS